MKNPKLGLCRGRLGLSFHGKILVNTCWPNMWKFWLKWKSWSKNVIFSRGVESGGGVTSNGFVSMIRCSKHFWGTCFHPNILMSSHLLNWRKSSFSKFWHFSFFWPFLRIFSLLKIAVNSVSGMMTKWWPKINKCWLKFDKCWWLRKN